MLDLNAVYYGDCLEVLQCIDDCSVNLIILDPPYLTTAENWDNVEVVTPSLTSQLFRVLTSCGNLYVWCGIGEKSWSLVRWFPVFLEHFHFKELITWKKQRGYGMRKGWLQTREELMWFVKDNKKFIWNIEEQYSTTELRKIEGLFTGKKAKSKFKRLTNVWTDIPEQNIIGQKNPIKFHFTPKPLTALERIITLHTKKGDVVLDCFAGSGQTAIACGNLNRNFILVDISQEYCKKMAERLGIHEYWDFTDVS